MKVLEPMLIKSTTDTATSSAAVQEIDFDFAALEGGLIFAAQGIFNTDDIVADLEADNTLAVAINYNSNFAPSNILTMANDDSTFFFSKINIVNVTAASVFGMRTDSGLELMPSGLLIVNNPSMASFATTGSPSHVTKLYYKRVLFDELELVPFVALRRR